MKLTIEGDETKMNRLLKKISSRVRKDVFDLTIDGKKAKDIEVKDPETVNADDKPKKRTTKKSK